MSSGIKYVKVMIITFEHVGGIARVHKLDSVSKLEKTPVFNFFVVQMKPFEKHKHEIYIIIWIMPEAYSSLEESKILLID